MTFYSPSAVPTAGHKETSVLSSAHQRQEQTDQDYPEKGLQAWLVVLGSWCAMIPAMGLLNSLGILHAWTSTHLLKDYSESSVGWIFGAYGFFLYLGGGQAGTVRTNSHSIDIELNFHSIGSIFDALGPHLVLVPGVIGIVVALICFSFSTGTASSMIEKPG